MSESVSDSTDDTARDSTDDVGQPDRRPSPRPGPTSRARRAAGASVGQPRPDAGRSATATLEPAAPAEEGPVAHRTRARSPRRLAAALCAALVVAVALLVLALRLPTSGGSAGQRDQALSAAKTEVATILSYDYRSFDSGVAGAGARLTGRARSDYLKAMQTSIKPSAVKGKVIVQAQTDAAGVESVSPDGTQVTVDVFGEQKVTNSSLSAPRTDPFRVRATLDLVGGHWLVSKFDQI
jgi:Mce-associated membrane protein